MYAGANISCHDGHRCVRSTGGRRHPVGRIDEIEYPKERLGETMSCSTAASSLPVQQLANCMDGERCGSDTHSDHASSLAIDILWP